jgi:pyruvate dehydrogenase E1 component
LAKTIKGFTLGKSFEGRNATHQMKKMTLDNLKGFRDELRIPISDAQLEENPYQPPYFHPGQDAPEIQYLHDRRRALGGYLPERRSKYVDFKLPEDKTYEISKGGSGTQEVATTMGFVRLLKDLLRAPEFGQRIAMIIPDEARTFGMDAFFPTAKIYNPQGQHYISVDRDILLSYKESDSGQIIHTGINEAGSVAAFAAAATSYATHGQAIIPFYVFYSMFGFQRTADSIWAAADQLSRGFLIGATAGRTTLTGEGLQHADGHSPIIAATNDAVISYDPAFAYEIGHIIRSGIERMYGGTHSDPNVMYYLTVYNEPMVQPAEPEGVDVDGIVRGIHKVYNNPADGRKAQILASGVALRWAQEAAALLQADWGVSADIWSVTSWTELRRDGLRRNEERFLNPGTSVEQPYLTQKLSGHHGPFLGVSDYMHQVPDQIREWVPGEYATLGAEGFGFSDTRAAARRHFKIDGPSVVVRVLEQLVARGEMDVNAPAQAIEKYRLHDVNAGNSGSAGGDA